VEPEEKQGGTADLLVRVDVAVIDLEKVVARAVEPEVARVEGTEANRRKRDGIRVDIAHELRRQEA